jgi:hypothetical protein
VDRAIRLLAVGGWQTAAKRASVFCLLPSAFCLLPPAFCLLPSAFSFLPTATANCHLLSPEATNLKTRCIKGDDDRHFKLTVTKIRHDFGIPAAGR